MIRILPLLFAFLFISCKSKEERAIEKNERSIIKIENAIAKLEAEIEEMTKAKSCATNPADCRLQWVPEGDACGPYFIYNSKDVDSVQLAAKFAELRKWEIAYIQADRVVFMCSRIFPDSLVVRDCKCEGSYGGR